MEDLVTLLDIGQSVAVTVLLWRTYVADRERSVLLAHIKETQNWIEGLVGELMTRTKN